MRIISKFKDYYDCMQVHDEDRQTLYIREERNESRDRSDFPLQRGGYLSVTYSVRGNFSCIGFCGNIYPVLHLSASPRDGYLPVSDTFAKSIEDVDAFVQKATSKKEYSEFITKPEAGRAIFNKRWQIESTFEWFKKEKSKFESIFLREKVPIFVVSESIDFGKVNVQFNACLRKYNFMRIFSPSQAYQELVMWIGNQAVPQKSIPVLDDETMAETKGFDRKFSFRKEKTRR